MNEVQLKCNVAQVIASDKKIANLRKRTLWQKDTDNLNTDTDIDTDTDKA